jgi:phage repressor protein C with HTH and peptisase S24 domain
VIEWIGSDIKGEHNFALRVKGDSMEPEFNEGDIIISPTAKAVTGDYVVAKNDAVRIESGGYGGRFYRFFTYFTPSTSFKSLSCVQITAL